jgi:hypothetical protein
MMEIYLANPELKDRNANQENNLEYIFILSGSSQTGFDASGTF